ncbi:hypothetical protein Klosneuvirus_4_95 [Klosneuvirus KNV1]|uniref:Uncharacterized protein n=1 Tax=Klosneuvirus KNV1 TaxID=1977640 RepID=A0A1V0SKM5_9VIRU|nr:hypothetical protein Klosneuvirus_4_95 [Klosneuvirus KNV1]
MSSKTIYKKEFIPDIGIGTSFMCLSYGFFQNNTSSNSVYKNAIDWIEKNRNTIEIVETVTENYSNSNLFMKDGKVVVYYRMKN